MPYKCSPLQITTNVVPSTLSSGNDPTCLKSLSINDDSLEQRNNVVMPTMDVDNDTPVMHTTIENVLDDDLLDIKSSRLEDLGSLPKTQAQNPVSISPYILETYQWM